MDTLSYASIVTSGLGVNVNLATNTVSGAAGADIISGFTNILGSMFSDKLVGDNANNVIDGGNNSPSGAFVDTLDGGAGNDTVSFASLTTYGATINLATQTASISGALIANISNFENIQGSSFMDNMTGDMNVNRFTGGGGNDIFNFNAVAGTSSDSTNDIITDFAANDIIHITASNVTSSNITLTGSGATLTYNVDLNNDGIIGVGDISIAIPNSTITLAQAIASTMLDITVPAIGNYALVGTGSTNTYNLGTNVNSTSSLTGGNGNEYIIFTDNGTATDDLNGFSKIDAVTLGSAVTNIVTTNALVGGGQTLYVFGDKATSLSWDGSAETDGAFSIVGSQGADNLKTGNGNDIFEMSSNLTSADTINGGTGVNWLFYTDDGNSTNELDNVSNIQNIVFGSNPASVVTVDNLVAAGQTLTVGGIGNGNGATANITVTSLNWDGSAETNGMFNITGSVNADVIKGGAGNDTITGGAGADMMTGGNGADTFIIASKASSAVVSGLGDGGIITGYDTITDFISGTDILDIQGTPVVAAPVTLADGNNSTLTIGGNAVGKHTINNGMITFYTQTDTPISLTSTANLAAVMQYLQLNSIGAAMSTVAMIVGSDSYIYQQIGSTPNAANDILVQLQGTAITGLGAGFTTVGAGQTIGPAGIAGEPIHLAISDPTPNNKLDMITLTLSGIPSNWSLNTGTHNSDGTWTVHTTDPNTLMITTAPDFVGAKVIGIDIVSYNADGTGNMTHISNNVEAYAPGSNIFALPGDDNLTGSSGNDIFVFQKTTGLDNITNFDVSFDKINFVDFASIHQFSDLYITNNAQGNALIQIAANQTIEIIGVNANDLTAAQFLFNETPYTVNNGNIDIGENAIMPFGGTLENNGTITISGTMLLNGDITGSGNIIFNGSGVLDAQSLSNQNVFLNSDSVTTVNVDSGSHNNYVINIVGMNILTQFDATLGDKLSIGNVKDANGDNQITAADLDAISNFVNIHGASGIVVGEAIIFNSHAMNADIQSYIDSFTKNAQSTGLELLQDVASYIQNGLKIAQGVILEGHSTDGINNFSQMYALNGLTISGSAIHENDVFPENNTLNLATLTTSESTHTANVTLDSQQDTSNTPSAAAETHFAPNSTTTDHITQQLEHTVAAVVHG